MVGGTGAGKSATIDTLLASLLTKYSPNELQLYMIDFKNVEFSKLSKDGISIIPHAKVLSGTKDGEYALSIFDSLIQEMEERNRIFTANGVVNIMEYREKFPNVIMPRIILLIDEFQVMFTEVDPSIVDKIKSRIRSLSKLARFCGVHMLFTSQSMTGTLDRDILDQFSLRCALRCSSETSTSILGNSAAGKIKTKQGYIYTNESGGEDPKANVFWRIPLLQKKDLFDTLEELNNMCLEHDITPNKALFYDEKELHGSEDLVKWYDSYPNEFGPDRVMLLGEKTFYTKSKAPVNFRLTRDDGEHIAAVAFEREDILDVCMTFIDNFNQKKDVMWMAHSADKDTHSILELDQKLNEVMLDISYPKQDLHDVIDMLLNLVEERKKLEENTTIYFLAIQWEKAKYIGREDDWKLTENFKTLLQEAPLVGIHFIFVFKEISPTIKFILNLCNHHIAAKCKENSSYAMLDTARAVKLPERDSGVCAIYQYGTSSFKFKIYQHKYTREIESRTIEIA
jgi:DNA segregation ATPase FtsK/SpoIIIE-like protein